MAQNFQRKKVRNAIYSKKSSFPEYKETQFSQHYSNTIFAIEKTIFKTRIFHFQNQKIRKNVILKNEVKNGHAKTTETSFAKFDQFFKADKLYFLRYFENVTEKLNSFNYNY